MENLVKSLVRSQVVPQADIYTPIWGFSAVCGKRPTMEDKVTCAPFLLPHIHFFGVYDGHNGSEVAKYCRDRLHMILAEEIKNGEWKTAFMKSFLKVDIEVAVVAPENVGSTAVTALISASHIAVANCGDSRAVLCRGKEAIALSLDHKPNREDELARIKEAGGMVIEWDGHRVFGVLAMSRAIGDRCLKPSVISEPEVQVVPRVDEDECLILASDGLWDVVSNEEACDLARRQILQWHKKNPTQAIQKGEGADSAAQYAAKSLSRLALYKGSKDNISVIIIDMKRQR